MTVRSETLTAHLPRTRWVFIPGTLLVICVVGMLDKIGVAVIATNPHFLGDLHLAHQPARIGLLVRVTLFTYGFAFPVWAASPRFSCSSSASSSLAYLRLRACTARGPEPGRQATR